MFVLKFGNQFLVVLGGVEDEAITGFFFEVGHEGLHIEPGFLGGVPRPNAKLDGLLVGVDGFSIFLGPDRGGRERALVRALAWTTGIEEHSQRNTGDK